MASPLDSPTAPEEPRKPRRARWPRWLGFALSAVAFLFIADWWAQRPLARIPLQDGNELLLVETHYRPTFTIEEPVPLWRRFWNFVARKGQAPLSPEPRILGDVEDPPSLWLVFEEHPKNSQPLHLSGINAIETTPVGFILANTSYWNDDDSPKTLRKICQLPAYPRRAPKLHLLLRMFSSNGSEQFIETTLGNPTPIPDAPNWTPEPAPQTRRIGTTEIVLNGLVVYPQGPFPDAPQIRIFEFVPDITVYEDGVQARIGVGTERDFDFPWDYADATGNRSRIGLPLGETAWKVNVSILPTFSYPFPKPDIRSLGHVTMPGPGEYRLLPLPPEPATGVVHHAALVGRGTYRIDLQGDLTIDPAPQPNGGASPGGHDETTHTFDEPVLLIPDKENFLQRVQQSNLGPHEKWIFRVAHGSDFNELESRFWSVKLGAETTLAKFLLRHPERSDNGIPPAGTDLEFQSILWQVRTAEFLIRPPKL